MLEFPLTKRSSGDWSALAESFRSSGPVRHVTIDNFIDEALAKQLLEDFPRPDEMPKSRDYMFSDKRELSTLDKHSEASKVLHEVFVSPDFADFLKSLLERDVFIDREYVGGGFHAGADGSFLDLHTDFNIHPAHQDWFRELNILLYLNPGWQASWGGQLILTDDPDQEGITVDPLFNRLVIMESTAKSFHGYHKLSFPEGHARRSIAAYAYSMVPEGSIHRRTTHWVPEDAGVVKGLLAKNWNWIVLTKNKFLGSGTLKNRR
jgi:Rps23 Pro-64 3,4-dihydroxylase Tpa1-like proline 4-hydroxylase